MAYAADKNPSKAIENYTAAIDHGALVPELFRKRALASFDCNYDADAKRDFA